MKTVKPKKKQPEQSSPDHTPNPAFSPSASLLIKLGSIVMQADSCTDVEVQQWLWHMRAYLKERQPTQGSK